MLIKLDPQDLKPTVIFALLKIFGASKDSAAESMPETMEEFGNYCEDIYAHCLDDQKSICSERTLYAEYALNLIYESIYGRDRSYSDYLRNFTAYVEIMKDVDIRLNKVDFSLYPELYAEPKRVNNIFQSLS